MVNLDHAEWVKPYSPSRDALPVLAQYLADGRQVELVPPPQTWGETPPSYFSIELQPYFAQQPFANLSHRFWYWRDDPQGRQRYLADTETKQAVVMAVGYLDRDAAQEARLLELGYRPTHQFCATNLYPRLFAVHPVCYVFYEPPAEQNFARP